MLLLLQYLFLLPRKQELVPFRHSIFEKPVFSWPLAQRSAEYPGKWKVSYATVHTKVSIYLCILSGVNLWVKIWILRLKYRERAGENSRRRRNKKARDFTDFLTQKSTPLSIPWGARKSNPRIPPAINFLRCIVNCKMMESALQLLFRLPSMNWVMFMLRVYTQNVL